jgi:hypothetical protein
LLHGRFENEDSRGVKLLTRYERHLALEGPSSLSARFAAEAAEARATLSIADDHHAALRSVASAVAAPMLVSYVLWVLLDARARGIKRLYFLSRDGQVLLEIAKTLAAKTGGGIDLRYLYASRQSWNRVLPQPRLQGWLWTDLPPRVTLNDLLQRLGTPVDDGRELIAAIGGNIVEGTLSAVSIRMYKELFSRPMFTVGIESSRNEQRNLLEEYLAQEGLFDETPKAIVDIGWIGTLHEVLSVLAAERGSGPVHGYFFGLKEFRTKWTDWRHGYYFNANSGEPVDTILPILDLLVVSEVFCAANHGTVVGFSRNDFSIVPQLANGRWPERVREWGLNAVRESIVRVAETLKVDGISIEAVQEMRRHIRHVLRMFWLEPDRTEAMAWSRFPWDAGQGSECIVSSLGEPYRVSDLPTIFRRRTLRKRHVFWIDGSLAISPSLVRWPFGFLKYVFKR